jgi:galactonate dehydratase
MLPPSVAAADVKITDVIAYPMIHDMPSSAGTSWKNADRTAIVIIEIRTDAGIVGIGECLGRFGSTAYAKAVRQLFLPKLLGKSPLAAVDLQLDMRRAHSGRAGGMTGECMSGIDIALWDIMGKIAGLPISALLGGGIGKQVPCYGCSVPWTTDESKVKGVVDRAKVGGFTMIKVKFGGPLKEGVRHLELVRKLAGDDMQLSADANWDFSLGDAVPLGHAMAALGYVWLEEPLPPEDIDGYRKLRDMVSVPLAAGESDYNGWHASQLIASRAISFIQPNVTRSGGITETRRIYDLAHLNHVAYAPHNGGSGIVCDVATLHLAAAAPNLYMVESVWSADPFKSDLGSIKRSSDRLSNGMVSVPDGPGLGLDLDWDLVRRSAPKD